MTHKSMILITLLFSMLVFGMLVFAHLKNTEQNTSTYESHSALSLFKEIL
jgi:hypothetical protein